MAVKIRLMRVGKKKQPTYRVVVADARSPRDGRFLEILGQYAPREDPSVITLDGERALHWLNAGAQPTESVAKLLQITGVWDAYKTEHGKSAAARPKPKTPKAKTVAAEPAPEPVAESTEPAEEASAEPATTEPESAASEDSAEA